MALGLGVKVAEGKGRGVFVRVAAGLEVTWTVGLADGRTCAGVAAAGCAAGAVVAGGLPGWLTQPVQASSAARINAKKKRTIPPILRRNSGYGPHLQACSADSTHPPAPLPTEKGEPFFCSF